MYFQIYLLRMIDVIQIYKSVKAFTKSSYTPESRKQFQERKNAIDSYEGYLEDGTLFLPLEYKDMSEIKDAGLIIIQDSEANIFPGEETENPCIFKQLNTPKSFEIFRIKRSDDVYELFLDYTSNALRIGIPKRDNHKICELKPSKPVRYKINGKSDFTMSGRKERSFCEFDYIIEWEGKAERIEFCALNRIKKTKTVQECIFIDERKNLR